MKQIIKKLAIVLSVALVCAPMGAMAANKLIVKDATGTIDKMVVTDTGRIGIGGVGSLNAGGVPDAGLYVKGAIYPENTIKVEGNAATGGAGYLGYLIKPSFVLPLNGERLGFFLFGSAANATTPLHAVGLTASAEGDWTTASTPANISFATVPSGSTGRFERMRISAAGNIGINTTTPTQRLEVNGGVRINTTAAKPTCNSTGGARGTIWFTTNNTGADALEVCSKDSAGNYAWRALY